MTRLDPHRSPCRRHPCSIEHAAATCTAVKHGTANAYRNHDCRCPSASRANGIYRSQLRAGIKSRESVSTIGIIRRRQALAALGWGLDDLAPHLQVASLSAVSYMVRRDSVTRATFDRWVAAYERLSMTPGPSVKTRQRALRMGWAPPLAWDDETIDDPSAVPDWGEVSPPRIDLAEVDHLELGGCHITEIARRMGVSVKGIEKARQKAGRAA